MTVLHEHFDKWLRELADLSSEVGPELLAEVLHRASLRAPQETSRVEIASGLHVPGAPWAHQVEIPQGTVSKAVKALMGAGFIEDGVNLMRNEAGRTLAPLRLGQAFCIAGVKVALSDGHPQAITTVLTGLDGSVLCSRHAHLAVPLEGPWHGVARAARRDIRWLLRKYNDQRQRDGGGLVELFGIGVNVAAHIYQGAVLTRPFSVYEKAVPLAEIFDDLFERAVPIVVENDVNALAVLATYNMDYPESDIVVVGVFDEGVGGGLVLDGRLRRGGAGMAMEIGHLSVGYAPGGSPSEGADPSLADFDPVCGCGAVGHLDAFAAPKRVRAVLRATDNREAVGRPAEGPGGHTHAYRVFWRAGGVLGRGLVHVVNLVNPTRVLLFVPKELADAGPASAGSAYLAAVSQELEHAYSTGGEDAKLTLVTLGPGAEVEALGAQAAAVCLFSSFIDHAKGLDGCPTHPRRQNRDREETR